VLRISESQRGRNKTEVVPKAGMPTYPEEYVPDMIVNTFTPVLN
jgi:hypothetical protein